MIYEEYNMRRYNNGGSFSTLIAIVLFILLLPVLIIIEIGTRK